MKKIFTAAAADMGLIMALSTCSGSDSDSKQIKDKGELTIGITLFAPMN